MRTKNIVAQYMPASVTIAIVIMSAAAFMLPAIIVAARTAIGNSVIRKHSVPPMINTPLIL